MLGKSATDGVGVRSYNDEGDRRGKKFVHKDGSGSGSRRWPKASRSSSNRPTITEYNQRQRQGAVGCSAQS